MEAEYKKFLNYYYQDNQSEFLKFRYSKELSQFEKSLLQSRIQFKKREYNEALEALEKQRPDSDYLMAQRYMQMATAKMCMGQFEEAIKFGNLALRFFDACEDQYGSFVSLFNLSVCFNRMSLQSLSHYYITQAEKLAKGEEQSSMVARHKACLYSHEEKYSQALEILKAQIELLESLSEFEQEAVLIVTSDICIRAGKLEEASVYVDQLLHSKSNREKSRIVYYYHLLKLLLEDKSLPEKPDAIFHSEEYSLKWDLIESAMDGDIETYQSLCERLGRQFPEFFDRKGRCIHSSERKALFSRVMSKIANSDEKSTNNLSAIKGKKGKLLVELLMQSDTPVRKEFLIEKIWEIGYDPKYNARFYKLIERVKQMSAIEIKNKNNAYFIAV